MFSPTAEVRFPVGLLQRITITVFKRLEKNIIVLRICKFYFTESQFMQ